MIYPGEHRRLAEQILAAGAIVSELPPDAKPDAQNFPGPQPHHLRHVARGRSSLKPPARSGALITATFAADQGREVFVVPGSVFAAKQ